MHDVISSATDPARAAAATVARLVAAGPPPLVITIGLGLGHLLDALEEANDTTRVLALEPSPATVRAMLARRDWSRWLGTGRLMLLVGPDYRGAAEAWRLFGPGASTSPPTLMASSLERAVPEDVAKAKATVRQILAGVRANQEARRQFAGRYLLNTLRNLPAIAAEGDVTALKGAFTDLPAIVVGAGPSLDRNLDLLRRASTRSIIIAVDTALRPLLAAGIVPHVVVAVDPSELNARHLRDLPDASGVWFVAEGSLDSSVLAPFVNRTFTFRVSQHEPWPWLDTQGAGRGTLRAWGSVLTTAFDLACEMGCGPIVFAGADLAYSRGLQYCRNTTYEPLWRDCVTDEARAERFKLYLNERAHLAEDSINGGQVLTAPHYVQFRDWIVSRAAEMDGRRVLNATGDGILFGKSIAQVNADDLVFDHPADAVDVRQRLHTAWRTGQAGRAGVVVRLNGSLVDAESLPVDTWFAFGGDTASREQIADAVDTAATGVAALAKREAYLAAERARFNAGADTLDQARALIHPDYELARTQARAQQAHLLMDYRQRTQPASEGGPMMDVFSASSGSPRALRVLDFGCGLGRAMEPFVEAGFDVDGVDFSERMIELARENPHFAESRFFLSDGTDCGDAPIESYDLACCLHAFHHIRPRRIRQAVLRSLARALRPGGVVSIQLPFYPNCAAAEVPAPSVSWSADAFDAPAGSRPGVVWPTADELPLILADFSRDFRDVKLQFVDLPQNSERLRLAPHHKLAHVIVSASKGEMVGVRIYAPAARSQNFRSQCSEAEARGL